MEKKRLQGSSQSSFACGYACFSLSLLLTLGFPSYVFYLEVEFIGQSKSMSVRPSFIDC